MNILIYGAGAVGCYLGGHLAQGDHQVTLLGRSRLVNAVDSHGLTIQTSEGRQQLKDIHAVTSLEDAFSSNSPYDWIAFTMKAYDTVPAIFDLQYHLPDLSTPVVSFQNGIGSINSLREAFGPDLVVGATMTTAVSMPEPGIVVEERQRGIAIAADSPSASLIIQSFSSISLNTAIIIDTASLKWSKLLLNMMANTIPAILDMSPEEVYADPRLFAIERAAFIEALHIMSLLDIDLVNLPGTPTQLLAGMMRYAPPLITRLILKRQVTSGRGEKMPSLQAALHAGHRRTEVAWLNGAVTQAADSINRLAPINHALALTLSDIAAGRVPWDMFRHKPDMLLTAIRAVQ